MTAALGRLGFAAAALGRFDEADAHLRRALELAREMQATSLLLHALSGVGSACSGRTGSRCGRGAVLLTRARGNAGDLPTSGGADPRRAPAEARPRGTGVGASGYCRPGTGRTRIEDACSREAGVTPLTSHREQRRELARRYTAAWCSQDPASVAENYAPDGSLTINDGPPSVGESRSERPIDRSWSPSRICRC